MWDFGEGQMESNFEKTSQNNIIAHKFLTMTKGDMTWSEGLTTCNIMFTNADKNITCHTIMHQPQRCRWSALAEKQHHHLQGEAVSFLQSLDYARKT